jgi:predicted DNA-binding protein (MmcQ/YjbR family)
LLRDYKAMTLEFARNYCLSRPGVTEEMPFGDAVLVYKVMGKIFALIPVDAGGLQMNLKCEPELAEELRALWPCVLPGYHMNKRHWNTILSDPSLPDRLWLSWIDNSYHLVCKGLPRKQKDELSRLAESFSSI